MVGGTGSTWSSTSEGESDVDEPVFLTEENSSNRLEMVLRLHEYPQRRRSEAEQIHVDV